MFQHNRVRGCIGIGDWTPEEFKVFVSHVEFGHSINSNEH